MLTFVPVAPMMVTTVDGPVTSDSADFVQRSLERAAAEGALLVVTQLDTQGNVDTSMRQIIRGIPASPVSVAAFVAARGALCTHRGLA